MRARRLAAIAAALLLCAPLAAFAQKALAVSAGRVVFFANGLVVLDVETGTVILREPDVSDARLRYTSHGVLVGEGGFPPQGGGPTRYRLFSAAGDPVWEVPCDLRDVEADNLVCLDRQTRIMEIRSFADGQVTATYADGRRPAAPFRPVPAWRPPPRPQWTPIEKEMGARDHPLQEGTLVSYRRPQAGNVVEMRSPQAERWQLLLPSESGLVFVEARQSNRLIVLHSTTLDRGFGALDAVDARSGRPRWRYVFPERSTSSNPVALQARRFSASAWRAVLASPPPPPVRVDPPLPLERYRTGSVDALTSSADDRVPVIFDPGALQPWPAFLLESTISSLPVLICAGLLLASRHRRLSPAGSVRRAGFGLGIFLLVVVVVIYYADRRVPAPALAEVVALPLVYVAYFNSLVAAVRVEAGRLTLLLRVSFAMVHIFLGMFLLGPYNPLLSFVRLT